MASNDNEKNEVTTKKQSIKSKRGPEPSTQTKYLLIARAAGRCQFCNKELLYDKFTLIDDNNSNLAHIVASSPDGPRGDEKRSFELSNKIENLMLMCLDHHHLIDSNEDLFTEDLLLEMKENHEKAVRTLAESITVEETQLVLFKAAIKNKVRVNITRQEAVRALEFKKRPKDAMGIVIEPKTIEGYHSSEYWRNQIETIDYEIMSKIMGELKYYPNLTFSVFPLAPIPLIAYFGYKLGDKLPVDIYQKHREPNSWAWQSDDNNSFNTELLRIKDGNKIAMILSLTNIIVKERVLPVYDADLIIHISAKNTGDDCIKTEKNLVDFWKAYQQANDMIKREMPDVKEIAVFPAVPVSAAFEMGRRYMTGVYPKLRLFDDDDGFFETLVIGD